VFFLAAALFNVFIFITAGGVTDRYFIPFMIFYIPLAALSFNEHEKPLSSRKRIAVLSAVLLFVFGVSFLNYEALVKFNVNAARKGYIKYLLDNQLDYGFATFGNANLTTELSNGKIELAGLAPEGLDEGKINFQIQAWLNPVKFYNSEYYNRESFLLLTNAEWKKSKRDRKGFFAKDARLRRQSFCYPAFSLGANHTPRYSRPSVSFMPASVPRETKIGSP
jgi:hypothetical protein